MDSIGNRAGGGGGGGGGGPVSGSGPANRRGGTRSEELRSARNAVTVAEQAYRSAMLAQSVHGPVPADHMIALQADYIEARNRLELVERHAPARLIIALQTAIQTTTGAMADLRDAGLKVTAATGQGIWGLAKGIEQWLKDQAEFPAAVAGKVPLGIREPAIVALLRKKAEGIPDVEAKAWHLAALDFRKSSGNQLLLATVELENQLALFQKLKATDAFKQKNIQPLYHPLILLLKYVTLWMGFLREHRAAKMITQLILGPTTAEEAGEFMSASQESNAVNRGTGSNFGSLDAITKQFTIRLVPILREIRDVSSDAWDPRPDNRMFKGDLQAMFAELSEVIGVRQEGGASILAIKTGRDRNLLDIMTKNLEFLNSTKGTQKDIEDILPADIKRRLMMGVVFQTNLLETPVLEGEALAATEGLAPMNEGGLTFEGRVRGVRASPDGTIQAITKNGLSPEERRIRNMTAARAAAAAAATAAATATDQRTRMQQGEQATVAALVGGGPVGGNGGGGAPALQNNTGPRSAKRAKTGGLDALAVAASEELARADARTHGEVAPIVADEEDEAALSAPAPAPAPAPAAEAEGGGASGGARRRLPKSKKKKTHSKNHPKTRSLFKRATRRQARSRK